MIPTSADTTSGLRSALATLDHAADPEATITDYGVTFTVRGDQADIARFVGALPSPAFLPAWLGGDE